MTWNTTDDRPSPNRLYRDTRNGMMFGVCAGIAEYFAVQPWMVRVFWALGLLMFAPPTVVTYLVLAAMLPKKPEQLYRNREEERFWQGVRVDPAQSFSELRHRFRELEQRLRRMESYVTSRSYRVQREIDDLDA